MKHRNLPHMDIAEHYQFVTFRTHDSVDGYLRKLFSEAGGDKKKQLAIDEYLDQSEKGAYLNGKALLVMFDFLKGLDGELYDLLAFCVMPNHVHMLIKPLDDLSVVMKTVKGGTARVVNRAAGREGRFWAEDYFDRLIRDEQHLRVVYEYIRNNPLKLCEGEGLPMRFYGIYE